MLSVYQLTIAIIGAVAVASTESRFTRAGVVLMVAFSVISLSEMKSAADFRALEVEFLREAAATRVSAITTSQPPSR